MLEVSLWITALIPFFHFEINKNESIKIPQVDFKLYAKTTGLTSN